MLKLEALKKIIVISLISISPLELKADCELKLNQCDEALDAAGSLIEAQERQIEIRNDVIYLQDKQLKTVHDLLKESNRWYERPAFVVPTTALLTILIIGQLGK